MDDLESAEGAATVFVPEVRDYRRINAELVRLLDAGHRVVTLAGVEGQRLLAAGLAGRWGAVVRVAGAAGPELAADLDAPGLTVVAPAAADGLGRGLIAGRVVVDGPAGDAAGYDQRGGVIVVRGLAGHRAGLRMRGGSLLLIGGAGRLAGDYQGGGAIYAAEGRVGPHPRRGASGGRWVAIPADPGAMPEPDRSAFVEALGGPSDAGGAAAG